MKTMCPPGYHHNGFVATHALGHIYNVIYIYISLRNSGAMYLGNKMPRRFQNFLVCLGNTSAKKKCRNSAEILVY